MKELHSTLIRLLNELSPWEPKLVRAFQRNRYSRFCVFYFKMSSCIRLVSCPDKSDVFISRLSFSCRQASSEEGV